MDLVPKRTGLVFDAAPVLRTFELSCATGEGIEAFERAIFELCPPEEPRPASEHALPEFLEYHPQARRRPTFRILRTDRGYRLRPRDETNQCAEPAFTGGVKRALGDHVHRAADGVAIHVRRGGFHDLNLRHR